jgi:hypothetical protein
MPPLALFGLMINDRTNLCGRGLDQVIAVIRARPAQRNAIHDYFTLIDDLFAAIIAGCADGGLAD